MIIKHCKKLNNSVSWNIVFRRNWKSQSAIIIHSSIPKVVIISNQRVSILSYLLINLIETLYVKLALASKL